MGHQALHQIGDAGAVDAGGSHDVGLTEAVGFRDRLQDSVLAGCQGYPDMGSEHSVRALSGSMQEMQQRLQRRGGRPRTLRHERVGAAKAAPLEGLMEDPEKMQQDDHEDRHACQPQNDIAQHLDLLR